MKIDSNNCAFCSLCIDVCPEKAIEKQGFKIIINENCTNCIECLNICPVGAISKN